MKKKEDVQKKKLQHLKEIEEIKDLIKEDLISKGEYVDDKNEIYNIMVII